MIINLERKVLVLRLITNTQMNGIFYIVLRRLSIFLNFAAVNEWHQVIEFYMSEGLIYSSDWLLLVYISVVHKLWVPHLMGD